MTKLYAVHLVRRSQLPKKLPEAPQYLGELPEVRAAFRALYNREPTSDEARRVKLDGQGEWALAMFPAERVR